MRVSGLYATVSGNHIAYVREFTPFGKWNGQFVVRFQAYGYDDNSYCGTDETGSKIYNSYKGAIQAAKRYVNKFNNNDVY